MKVFFKKKFKKNGASRNLPQVFDFIALFDVAQNRFDVGLAQFKLLKPFSPTKTMACVTCRPFLRQCFGTCGAASGH